MKQSIEKQLNKPVVQALAALTVAAIIMSFGWLFKLSAPKLADPLFAWSIGAAFMLFFALMNSLLSLRADSLVKYWQASIYSYMALAFGTGLLAWGFSGLSIGDAGSYKWIYLVISVGFVFILLMVFFLKTIVNFAEKEEWNEPRRRK